MTGTGRSDRRTQRVRTARTRSASSARWLERQLNDPFVAEARSQGFRARSAFKLIQLDQRFRVLRPGAVVVDLGAAPGGWTQVAVERVRAAGRVVGLDVLEMAPIAGATLLQGDIHAPDSTARIVEALGGRRVDVVLSDMAASTTGHSATDYLRTMALAEAAYGFARPLLTEGGAFLCKLFQGGAEREFLTRLKQDFASVRHAKPPASRPESRETYLVALGFRGRPDAAVPAEADQTPAPPFTDGASRV